MLSTVHRNPSEDSWKMSRCLDGEEDAFSGVSLSPGGAFALGQFADCLEVVGEAEAAAKMSEHALPVVSYPERQQLVGDPDTHVRGAAVAVVNRVVQHLGERVPQDGAGRGVFLEAGLRQHLPPHKVFGQLSVEGVAGCPGRWC